MSDDARAEPDERPADGTRRNALPSTGVLFFSTPGCASCRAVRSRIADLDDRSDVPIVEVAGDADAANRFRVHAAPTLIALHGGVEVTRHAGTAPGQVIDRLCDAAAAGSSLHRRHVPAGLTAVRVLVAAVLATVGAVTSTPTLTVIGVVVAVWAAVPLARNLYELRTR